MIKENNQMNICESCRSDRIRKNVSCLDVERNDRFQRLQRIQCKRIQCKRIQCIHFLFVYYKNNHVQRHNNL